MKLLAFVMALAAPAAALAADKVTLNSEVFVERQVRDASGKPMVKLEAPSKVTPGDRLLFVLKYKNVGNAPATAFTVTNPMPSAVSYSAAASEGAVMSIDGGRNWAPLGSLKVGNADGTFRPAAPADVTHIRWTLKQPIAAGGQGQLSFRGAVK